MKTRKYFWPILVALIWVIVILCITAWSYAKCDYREWAGILLNLFITILGAFLGFFAALWLDNYSKQRKDCETKIKYTQRLLQDINNISSKLVSMAEEGSQEGRLSFPLLHSMFLHFEFPVWDALVSTGEINLFSNEPFFGSLCEFSAKIKSFNSLQNNIMIGRLIKSKIIIDATLEQKLNEIYILTQHIANALIITK